MTRDEIAARNRANAQKSTGPKTASGKATVSNNARKHGATSRPDPKKFAIWLKVILDDPEIKPDVLMPTDERGVRALLLAQAEAQLVAAQKALREFEAGMPVILRKGIHISCEDILEGFQSGAIPRPDMTLSYREVSRRIRAKKEEYKLVKHRQKLLKRYLGEARARRRKALSAWLVASGGTATET